MTPNILDLFTFYTYVFISISILPSPGEGTLYLAFECLFVRPSVSGITEKVVDVF